MTRRFLALTALLLSTCDATAPAADRFDALSADATISLGGTATLDGLAVTFERVAEDSCCPDGAACITAGRARLGADGEPFVLSVPTAGWQTTRRR